MSTEENKMIARRQFEDIWNRGKLDLIDTYFAPDFLNFGNPCPPERVRQIVLAWRTAFPREIWRIPFRMFLPSGPLLAQVN